MPLWEARLGTSKPHLPTIYRVSWEMECLWERRVPRGCANEQPTKEASKRWATAGGVLVASSFVYDEVETEKV